MTTETLPPALAEFVVHYRGARGIPVYLNELPGATSRDLEEWVTAGWLKKSVACFDDDGEERVVDYDARTKSYWDEYGKRVPDSDVVTFYLTTDKTTDSPEARVASLDHRTAQLSALVVDRYEEFRRLPDPGSMERTFRFWLCSRILGYEGSFVEDPIKQTREAFREWLDEGPPS